VSQWLRRYADDRSIEDALGIAAVICMVLAYVFQRVSERLFP
jgi:hypothetical protein